LFIGSLFIFRSVYISLKFFSDHRLLLIFFSLRAIVC
jgi:hypothetical protein